MANPGGLVFTVHIAKRMDERYGSSCFSAERLRGRKACGKFAARPQAPCASDCSVGCAASPSNTARPLCQCRIGSRSPTAWQRLRSSIASRAFIVG